MVCQTMLADRNIQDGRVAFRFPQGARPGAVFEVEVNIPARQIVLPYALFGDRINVIRYGMIE